MRRKWMMLSLFLLTIGFASISTTLFVIGSAEVQVNDEDFLVYYSDAKVNGVRDVNVIESETSLVFSTVLDTLGQEYVLDYDVTNGSKNYDADIEMTCTGGNSYLTVKNDFDDDNHLNATETRSGKLTLKLTTSYTGEDLDVDITCTILAIAVERTSLGEEEVPEPLVNPYAIGTELTIEDETFNIVNTTNDTVTLLARYNLDSNYRQSEEANALSFADVNGWEYIPGPKDIEIQNYNGNVRTYVNEYVTYLRGVTGDNEITSNLITLEELGSLDCIVSEDYSQLGNETCRNSKHKSWLINGQEWWTRSANTGSGARIWFVTVVGRLNFSGYTGSMGIRPTITMSKSTFDSLKNS